MKIIVVEDDKVLSLLLSKMIERLGHEIISVVTKGSEAIDQIIDHSPDLILMDIMLEDNIDGITVMEKIRENNLSHPVIYITGNSDSVNYDRAKATGFEEYLIKPVSFDDLKSNIKAVEQKKP
ncbi:response regulator [Gracilimonas amylolytica]|uniref:response regulator n=1 Tax=Gracilimonas amylolytica TaxID=1749045 RepID=UPI000CD87EB5|nr:response regulator [Gracilimonas amylolytica]